TIEAVKSTAIVLERNDSVEQGFQKIIGNCLQQVQANEAGVLDGGYPESVHQTRVGLRRLRSAIRMFDSVIPCPPALREEIAWLSQELGVARDWDVLSESTIPRIADIPEDIPADIPLPLLQAAITDH